MDTRKAVLLRLALAASIAFAPVTAAVARAQSPSAGQQGGNRSDGISVPVTGTVQGVANSLTGTFTIQRFERAGDGIVAVGTLVARVTDASGAPRTIVTQLSLPVDRQASGAPAAPVAEDADLPDSGPAVAVQAACDILHLELGPLDLNLLGLVIHLDRVVLDITAVPGPGNLLGNLLCAIVGLLDGTGQLGQLLALLNQLLDLLG
jgi:hypothetical protein